MPTWLVFYLESIATAELHPAVAFLVIALFAFPVIQSITAVFTKGN